MQTDDGWKSQRENLEESFFLRRNQELLASLRAQTTAEEQKRALASASGITDAAVLDHLLAANLRAETITAVGMIPLLAVAWADGCLEPQERQAVLAACEAEGIAPGHPGFELLHGWLQEHPTPDLLEAWKDFIGSARQRLSPEAFQALREDVLSRAGNVAKSSGGFLGLHKVSVMEAAMLEELKAAFAPPPTY